MLVNKYLPDLLRTDANLQSSSRAVPVRYDRLAALPVRALSVNNDPAIDISHAARPRPPYQAVTCLC